MKMTKMIDRGKWIPFFAAMFMVGAAHAATYYVKPDGDDDAKGTSWATALATPNKGFAKVNSNKGSTLIITNGTYRLAGAIGCTGGADEANRTVVKSFSGNPNDVIFDAHGESEGLRLASYITISGITVSNGVNTVDGTKCPAAGIRFSNTSTSGPDYEIIVTNCVVTCCTNIFPDGMHGAAVALYGHNLMVDSVVRNNTSIYTNGAGVIVVNRSDLKGPPKLLRCRIEGNSSANSGGGVYISGNINTDSGKSGAGTVVEIEDCEIIGNTAANTGAGIFCPGYFHQRITGCIISNNTTAANGGGLRFEKGSATLVNCLVADNSANNGAGVDIVPTATSPDAAIATLYCSNTTFRQNKASVDSGGAVRIHQYGRAFFDNCRFEGNKVTRDGGGDDSGGGAVWLANQGSHATSPYGYCSVSNCVFGGNVSGGRGGALGCTWNTNFYGAVVNCIFTNNQSRIQGGGLCIREAVANLNPAIIRNCLFAFNETTGTSGDTNGGGICLVTRSNLVVENCTIVSNNIRTTNSTYNSGGIHHRWAGTLKNCIVAFNTKNGQPEGSSWTAGDNLYFNCCGSPAVTRFTATNGCINDDPKFTDPASGDFTLRPDSPCINKGLNADWMTSSEIDPVTGKRVKVLDLAGSVRLSGSHVDIGCYELYIPKGLTLSVK